MEQAHDVIFLVIIHGFLRLLREVYHGFPRMAIPRRAVLQFSVTNRTVYGIMVLIRTDNLIKER